MLALPPQPDRLRSLAPHQLDEGVVQEFRAIEPRPAA